MLNEILRFCAITALLIIALQFLKVVKGNKNAWFVVAFALSVVCYLIIEGRTEITSPLLKLLLVGPFLLPLFFWLLSKSIFNDHFKMSVTFFTLILAVLLVQYISLYIWYNVSLSANGKMLAILIPKLLSFMFMALGVWEALRSRKFDLIDARLRFRNIFIIVTASVIGATLIVETIGMGSATPEILPVIQKAVIIILSLIFIYYNLELNLSFFIRPEKEEKREPENDSNSQIASKIQKLLTEEKIYRTEGLTIGRLAETMKEQEYRVRRTINGQLGFRNFNDFLNQYRVQEACTILQDPQKSNLTILEIAYSLGYQSIGPFNKAFKDQTGLAPTIFRKQKLQ
ncbi:MAG: AraC family transcriptional regulator [Bacteroidota bacterium]